MFFLGRLFVHNRGLVVVGFPARSAGPTPADTMIVIRLFTIHGDLAAIELTLDTLVIMALF